MWRCTDSSTAAPCSTAAGRIFATSSHRTGPPPVVAFVLVEEIAETLAPPVQSYLRGGHRDAQLLGDFFVRESVDVLQHDEHAELRRQRLECERETVEHRARLGGAFGLQVGVHLHRVLAHRVERRAVTVPGSDDEAVELSFSRLFVRGHLRLTPVPGGYAPWGPDLRERSAGLAVQGVLAVEAAVLLHLDALAVVRLVLHGDVVPPLALLARQRHLDPLVARHRSLRYLRARGCRVRV